MHEDALWVVGQTLIEEDGMEAINALLYVMGIYGLTLVVALFVALIIVGIRRVTADRIRP